MGNFYGCPCRPDPIWIPFPTFIPRPTPTTQAPLPPATQAPPPHPNVCPDNWIAIGLAQTCGITTGCGGNFGAIFFNGCKNLHLGADDTWCGGQWVKGWNVQCGSNDVPSVVTTPNGNFGYCFELSRNCGLSVGVASSYNYQYYCCSPL